MSGCIGVNAGEVYTKLVVGGGERSGDVPSRDAGGVWKGSSSSLIRSIRGRGGGASVMRSSRLSGGLGGRGLNSPMKGDKIVVGGVVVIVNERRVMGLKGLGAVVFKVVRRLIAVGCF